MREARQRVVNVPGSHDQTVASMSILLETLTEDCVYVRGTVAMGLTVAMAQRVEPSREENTVMWGLYWTNGAVHEVIFEPLTRAGVNRTLLHQTLLNSSQDLRMDVLARSDDTIILPQSPP